MSERAVAVSIGGNWLIMEMVDERASRGRQVGERDRERDTDAIGVCSRDH